MYNLSDEDFKYVSTEIYNYANINLTEKKRALIISRLSKRARKLKFNSINEYLNAVRKDNYGPEFQAMVDSLSTNFTHFFREIHHFEFLENKLLPVIDNELKIWSAASSTGQEIYSILMTIKEYELKNKKKLSYKLFASDISRNVLTAASKGVYNVSETDQMSLELKKRYFLKGNGKRSEEVMIKPELIKKVKFFRLNLSDSEYRLPVMDVIFLRNVIIYFDSKTREELINKLYKYIKPGGFLILGHSETLTNLTDKFTLVGKTIYRRI